MTLKNSILHLTYELTSTIDNKTYSAYGIYACSCNMYINPEINRIFVKHNFGFVDNVSERYCALSTKLYTVSSKLPKRQGYAEKTLFYKLTFRHQQALPNQECSICSQFYIFMGKCSTQVLKNWNQGTFLFTHGYPFAQSLKDELCQLLDDSEQNICSSTGNDTSFPCSVVHFNLY